MNREDIIRMAREAGIVMRSHEHQTEPTKLERFAALVAAAEQNRTWTQDHWTEYERSIAAAEREACAKVCDFALNHAYVSQIAAAIRARGEK